MGESCALPQTEILDLSLYTTTGHVSRHKTVCFVDIYHKVATVCTYSSSHICLYPGFSPWRTHLTWCDILQLLV